MSRIGIIGAGLAGTEAALQLAKRGHDVTLYDMKPEKRSPAHHSNNLAEIVCSNSFGSQGMGSASGVLKLEMATLDCELMHIAHDIAVPAGKALAVDRDTFSQRVTERIKNTPNITFIGHEQTDIPKDHELLLIATGPLTSDALAEKLSSLLGQAQLFFFDAAAPIIAKDSINFDIAFIQDRYALEVKRDTAENTPGFFEGSTEQSYINCPMNKEEYERLIAFILAAEKTPLKSFEENKEANLKGKAHFFEGCLPVEEIASRGIDTLRFGPMKPVGLVDPRTGERPYAVVQLRQDNQEGSLYNIVGFQNNIKWGPQKEMVRLIPGLENADVVRYGVMHRNTYLQSPDVLLPTLQLKAHPHIFIGGQLTGTEGYSESIATGLMAAINMHQLATNETPMTLPQETMLGALLQYITREEASHIHDKAGKKPLFQPVNSNWGILPTVLDEHGKKIRKKRERNFRRAEVATHAMKAVATQLNITPSAVSLV